MQLGFTLYDSVRSEFIPPEDSLDLGTTNADVKRIQRLDEVNLFLNQYHYLHGGQAFKSIGTITRCYGLYLGGELAAVVVYNPPAVGVEDFLYSDEIHEAYLYKKGVLAMTRLTAAPDAPFNSTGFLISKSLKLIWLDNKERERDNRPLYKTVITFADTMFHSGTTYRAQNAWYAGISKGEGLGGFYNPETGDYINTRQGARTLTRKDCPEGWLPFTRSDKLRYLFFLGGQKEQLRTMRKLGEKVKVLCKLDQFSVFEEGRIVGAVQEAGVRIARSYDEVYQRYGKRGTEIVHGRYTDYLRAV